MLAELISIEWKIVEDYLRADEDEHGLDILLMKEVPRRQPGWTRIREIGKYAVIGYQDEDSWRGTAIAVNQRKFQILRQRSCAHGIWVQVGDVFSDQKIWLGSAYLSTGVPLDEYQLQYRMLLEQLPPTGEATIMGGDINVGLAWQWGAEDPISSGASAKLRGLKSACAARKLLLVSQRDPALQTHVSRRDPAVGGQIDCFWSSRVQRCGQTDIEEGSRKIIGTDHELISVTYQMEAATCKKRVKVGGPRTVSRQVDPPELITQEVLQNLAETCTSPLRKPRCVLPENVRVLRAAARQDKTPQAWKAYMQALRAFRTQLQNDKFAAAASDWGEYRRVRQEQKNIMAT